MADADAWKMAIADAHWKKGQADALEREWEDVSAAEVEAARRKKGAKKENDKNRSGTRGVASELASSHALARMRGLLGEI